MNVIRKRHTTEVLLATAVVLAVVLAATACTSSDNPNRPSVDTPGQQEGETGAERSEREVERRRADRAEGSITLGDLNRPQTATELGAPFDPCTIVDWNDFPAEVRPTDGEPHTPQLRAPDADDPYDIRCLYDNSGKIVINTDGSSPGAAGGYFMTSIVWSAGTGAADGLDADPANREGSAAKSWNGKSGLIQRFPDDPKTGKSCLGLAALSSGVGGVTVSDSRFNSDPCTTVDALMAAVTARASR